MKADGWACHRVSPWAVVPPSGTQAMWLVLVLWTLKMVQVEVDRGVPALWQEVQAHRSSSCLPSPPLLFALALSRELGALG